MVEQRRKAVEEFMKVADTFEGSKEKVREFIVVYTEMIAYFHFRWIFKQFIESAFMQRKLELPIEKRTYLDTYVNEVLTEASTENRRRGKQRNNLVGSLKKYEQLFTGMPRDIEEAIQRINPDILNQIKQFANEFPITDDVDLRLGLSMHLVFLDIKKAMEARAKTEPKLDIKKRKTIREVPVKDKDDKVTAALVKVYTNSILYTEDEHISQLRGQFKIREGLLKLAEHAVTRGLLKDINDIFELTSEEIVNLVNKLSTIDEANTHGLDEIRNSGSARSRLDRALKQQRDGPITVTIDGPSGVGKTLIAYKISKLLNAFLFTLWQDL